MTHDDPDYYDILRIGIIDLEDSVGKCKVELHCKNDCTTDFRIIGLESDFDCNINILESSYASNTKDKLTDIQCILLNRWMTEFTYKFGYPFTNWQVILMYAMGSEDTQTITKTTIQPRYDLINYYNKEI